MATLKEHCGVLGVYSYSGANVTPLIIKGLIGLQHRGQESFGFAVNGNGVYKKAGLVYYGYIEDREKIDSIKGHSGIGHVRYSTSGSANDIGNFHPIEVKSSSNLRLAHNGTISNTSDLRALLINDGEVVNSDANDTELSARLLSKFFKEKGNWASAFEAFDRVKNGSYCFAIQTEEGDVLAARDGRGYKPLCYGYQKETDTHIVASESFALQKMGAKKLKDIMPGELVILDKNGPRFQRFAPEKEKALDSFEITYFAHPASTIDGIQIAAGRANIGRALFKKFKILGDAVVPIPESAVHAAEGYSQESGVPMIHALGKDRYGRRSVLRSFIQPSERKETVESMFVIEELVRGKELVVIDDSIVRGTSSRTFVQQLRNAGAKKISLLSTFPPIRFPCYMGIDFPSSEELIAYTAAAKENVESVGQKVAGELGADFVGYMDPIALSAAVGLRPDSFCFACVNGDYSKLNFTPTFKSRKEMKGE